MTAIEIVNQGHESYYNEEPRYKNPYEDNPGLCDNAILWFFGWDQANQEHDLFTKNKSLEAENKELFIENEGLKKANKELSRLCANVSMSLSELKIYVEGRNWFQFSREKVIEHIEDIDEMIKDIHQ